MFDNYRQLLDYLYSKLRKEASLAVTQSEGRIEKLAPKLNALSPLAVLDRGYAICMDKDGKIVKNAMTRREGEELDIRLRDGMLNCEVKGIEGSNS